MPASKTAVILGATADIGRHLAERLSSDHWNVVAIGRTAHRLRELEKISTLRVYQCSIANNNDVKRLADDLRAVGCHGSCLYRVSARQSPLAGSSRSTLTSGSGRLWSILLHSCAYCTRSGQCGARNRSSMSCFWRGRRHQRAVSELFGILRIQDRADQDVRADQ